MSECKIYLDSEKLAGFYGLNHVNIDRIKRYFPELKILARGDMVKAEGEPERLERFKLFMDSINLHLDRYNKIDENDIERINLNDAPHTRIDKDVLTYGLSGRPIKARTASQHRMVEEYTKNDMLFAVGPAGTGKTYLAISLAVKALKAKEVRRIILSRPAVEAGERLGFLPGDLKMKLDPYLQALYDALNDMIPAGRLNDYMEQGVIQIAPLAYMRGRTLSDAVVILDEAQNTTLSQLKMFLTRMGENSKFIITGDVTQIDLPDKYSSGLLKAAQLLQDIEGISFVYFDKKDVLRHKLVSAVVDAFERADY